MVLSNTQIKSLVDAGEDGLIASFNLKNLKNSSYTVSVGRIFQPETGEEVVLSSTTQPTSKHSHNVEPSEVILIQSKEKVQLPKGICASYTPTLPIAQKGLQLINNSIVEPGYHGYLSCILVNFSKSTVCISEGDLIAKLQFLKLDQEYGQIKGSQSGQQIIKDNDYIKGLAKVATRFNETFLDVRSIEDRAKEKALSGVSSQITKSSIFIAILLIFATIQPFISSLLKEKSDAKIGTNSVELIENRIDDLEKQLETLKSEAKETDHTEQKNERGDG